MSYALLAAWLCTRCGRLVSQVGIVMGASLMIVAVVASRLYLEAHDLTDVVAAFFAGAGWLVWCHVAQAGFQHRNELMESVG